MKQQQNKQDNNLKATKALVKKLERDEKIRKAVASAIKAVSKNPPTQNG